MKLSNNKEINEVVEEAVKHGWKPVQGRKHSKLYHPKGKFVKVSCTPSCPHSANQLERDIRRIEKENE